MAKKKFIPMTGLDNLTEDEKREYYESACEYYGLPVDRNLLEYMWLDSGDGAKHLVLYAKRGATDLLRKPFGIYVDEMKETIGDGFIMFTAKGHDKDGRTDIAVGSASTRNLTGKALDNAIMTAQTRATRRLTLQFVGGGLLDESEIIQTTTSLTDVSTPLKNISVAPTVAPNSNPGEEVKQIAAAANEIIREAIAAAGAEALTAVTTPPSKEFAANLTAEEQPRKRRRRKGVVLESPGREAPAPGCTHGDGPRNADIYHHTGACSTPEPTPVQVEARAALEKSLPLIKELAKNEAVGEELAKQGLQLDKARISQLEAELAALRTGTAPKPAEPSQPVVVAAIAKNAMPEAVPAQPNAGLPKPEQRKAFQERLDKYVIEILPKGGMVASEGIGGVNVKVARLARLLCPGTIETKYLATAQWEAFLGYMDEKLNALGPAGLVQLIDQKVGAKNA